MKFLKWLVIGFVSLIVIVGIGLVVIVNSVDWNNYRETIQNQTAKHTGRELTIAGDLSPSFFPWTGISIGGVSMANAEGFDGDTFAKVDSADVKVELLPLLRREINVQSVELNGLTLNLQRNVEGITNWDDLAQRESTTTTESEEGTTTEVQGNSPTIAALAVGGINVSGADVRWQDDLAETDIQLSDFSLETGTIELNKPFDLASTFQVASNAMGLDAKISANTEVMADLDNQVYGLSGLNISVDASGEAFPSGELQASLEGNVVAELVSETLEVSGLVLSLMGLELTADASVTGLNSQPVVVATAASSSFNPREILTGLGIELPQMADDSTLTNGAISLNVNATPESVAIDNLNIQLDDSKVTGSASVPDLTQAMPPVRFDLSLDGIDLDRYMPAAQGGDDTPMDEGSTTDTTNGQNDNAGATGDESLALPVELIRSLDIDGSVQAGTIKVSNLTTENLVVPITVQNGVVGLDGIKAALYEGALTASSKLDVSSDTPTMAAVFDLGGIQAEPLLQDLLQGDAPISGGSNAAFDLSTQGDSVNALKAALNGTFSSEFTDGALNGINIGYQLRRAKALLTGQSMPEQADVQKTDFSSLAVSGDFTNGVMESSDLDIRSPLLRMGGAGTVDLPQELVDYTATIKVTASTEGQGGEDLSSLKGLELDVPIQATFAELAENPAKVMISGMSSNLTGNLQKEAEALAKQKADEAKAAAEAALAEQEAKARERLAEEQAAAEEKVNQELQNAEEKLQQEAGKATEKLKKGLGGLLGN